MANFKQLLEELVQIKKSIHLMLQSGHGKEAVEKLQQVARYSFELTLADVRNMPPQDLLILLINHRQLNSFQLYVLAELLILEAEAYFSEQSLPESRTGFEYGTIIFQYLHENRKKEGGIDIDSGETIAFALDMLGKVEAQSGQGKD